MHDWTSYVAERDFHRAHVAARGATLLRWLRGRPHVLIPLDEVRTRLLLGGQRDRGLQVVPLDAIVGSEGRAQEFNRSFRPRHRALGERWRRIRRAQLRHESVPPVELIKIGEVYFVRDGNHRVSVARQQGQADIDAHVVELETNVPFGRDVERADLEAKAAQSRFVADIGLRRVRPDAVVPHQASDAATYAALWHQVQQQRTALERAQGRPVRTDEAVGAWYDEVYLPQVTAIRQRQAAAAFPGMTETQLLVAILEHRRRMAAVTGADGGVEAAVLDYIAQYSPWCRRWRTGRLRRGGMRLMTGLRQGWARLREVLGGRRIRHTSAGE